MLEVTCMLRVVPEAYNQVSHKLTSNDFLLLQSTNRSVNLSAEKERREEGREKRRLEGETHRPLNDSKSTWELDDVPYWIIGIGSA